MATTKTENSRGTVYLLDDLFHDLESYKAIQDSIARQYPGYNPDANFHALRHAFAIRSLEQGMDVVTLSRLLGHANPSITLDKYGHALDDHKKASIGKLGRAVLRNKKNAAREHKVWGGRPRVGTLKNKRRRLRINISVPDKNKNKHRISIKRKNYNFLKRKTSIFG